jgi:glycosyltransferase involved in cell wall biosynthesis
MKDFLDAHNIGFNVDPNDPASLADCLIALDANKMLKDELGRNAAVVAREHFDKSKLAADMLAALKKAM